MDPAEHFMRQSLAVLHEEIAAERCRQLARWPDCENVPDGTWHGGARLYSMGMAKIACDRAYREGKLTHAHVFEEECMEVLAEEDPVALRQELIQVISVCAKWIQDIDSRPK